MRKAYNNNKSTIDTIVDFVKINWMFIVGFILVWPWLRMYILKTQNGTEKAEEELAKDREYRENQNPSLRDLKIAKVFEQYGHSHYVSDSELIAAAQKLSVDFGTAYSDTDSAWSFLDPRGWTENDAAAFDTLAKYPADYTLITEIYYIVTRSRDLGLDIQKFLDKEYIIQLAVLQGNG
jgi:hypothetical protein